MSDQDQSRTKETELPDESTAQPESVEETVVEETAIEEDKKNEEISDASEETSIENEEGESAESVEETPSSEKEETPALDGETQDPGEDTEDPGDDTEESEEPKVQQQILARIRFRPAGEPCLVNTGGYALQPTQKVVVEIDRSLRLGYVLEVGSEPKGNTDNLPRVVRIANSKDEHLEEENKERSRDSFQKALVEIEKLHLPMKLIEVEYLHTGHKAIFYFSADGRVDFRQLVRNLAHQLRIRVEMRQIGIRDEAKIVGGIGPCGLQTCCSSWLTDFVPVSIKMAKEQNLSLKPQKVSGLCDRLMCCLSYESSHYRELQRGLPKIGKKADTWKGRGRLLEVNIAKRTMRFDLEGGKGPFICSVEDFKAFKEDPENFTPPQEHDNETQRIDEQLRHTPSLREEAANGITKGDNPKKPSPQKGGKKRQGTKDDSSSDGKPQSRSRSRGRRRRKKKPAGGQASANAKPNQSGQNSTSSGGSEGQGKSSKPNQPGSGHKKPKPPRSRRRRRKPAKPKTDKPT